MTTVTQIMHIDAAPETVFARIVDPYVVPAGMTMQTLNESTEGVGNVYEWTYRLVGILVRGIVVYTQYVPNRRFAYKSLGMVAASALFTVEPQDGGTRLTREVDFRVHIPLLGRMLEGLMVKAAEPHAVRTVACPKLVDFFLRRGVERPAGFGGNMVSAASGGRRSRVKVGPRAGRSSRSGRPVVGPAERE